MRAHLLPRGLVFLALATAALAQEEQEEPPFTPVRRPPKEQVIPHPSPTAGARFGTSVVWLDFDGDGKEDLAVAAPGEDAVYVFRGPGLETARRYTAAEGEAAEGFGSDIAAGELDGEAGEELVIGASSASPPGKAKAGRVFLLAKGDEAARPLELAQVAGAMLGTSVAVGDYDGDGQLDVAAGAPKTPVGGEPSGSVVVQSLAKDQLWRFDNPLGAWKHGNYGHDLATGDANGDGKDDLFVSSIGNRSASGIRGAGQAFVLVNPVPSGKHVVVEDPLPKEKDGARFGMSIDAGDVNGDGKADFLVGAPRKNGGGVNDAGQGFVFLAPEFTGEDAALLLHPSAIEDHLLGFRALAADIAGDAKKEAIFVCLGGTKERALLVWDGGQLAGEPWILAAPEAASGHFVQGFAAGRAAEGARQPLALGDFDFDSAAGARTGRVVIWRFEG